MSEEDILKMIEKRMWEYHTAHIRNVEEARKVYQTIKELAS